ncbi:LuxR C-terminal-related transcriptional regulator [Ruegeria arenilitoris]|uniref:LuxR C-terminal-related transcriptional regulator n=1 Tax=Ruegeria arenilitoris TaxID=1173585 RepID=UPI001480DE58|nr:LuxR C-terminal-related transcriptional regulator [Ruegeria arenilitoris]
MLLAANVCLPPFSPVLRLPLLGITEGTVEVHRNNANSKLGVSSQAELFSAATRYLASKQT